jgi:anti-sigma B factor antagonist
LPNLPATPASSPLPSSGLRVAHHEPQPGWCVVEVDGEVDLATAPVLRAALVELLVGRGYRRFVIELSRVGHIDSTGLGVLAAFRQRLGAVGALTLAGLQPNVRNVLRRSGLERGFEIWPSTEERWNSMERPVGGTGSQDRARPA